MAKKKTTDRNQTVTVTILNKTLNKAIKPIFDKLAKHERRFDEIDRRFDVIETRLEMGDRRDIGMNARIEALEKTVRKFDENMKDYFTKMYSHIDAFAKRTEYAA